MVLSKDVSEEMQLLGDDYEPKLKIGTRIMVRPIGSSIVFVNGTIVKVIYSVSNMESEVRDKPFKHFTLPKLEADDSCQLQYLVKYQNHAYINLKSKAMGGQDCKSFKYQFEKEYFPGELIKITFRICD